MFRVGATAAMTAAAVRAAVLAGWLRTWTPAAPADSAPAVSAPAAPVGLRLVDRGSSLPVAPPEPELESHGSLSDGHVDEARIVQLRSDGDRIGRAVAMFGDDEVRLPRAR
jgi:hypothetical protein